MIAERYWRKGYNDKCYENRLFIILVLASPLIAVGALIVHFQTFNRSMCSRSSLLRNGREEALG